MNHAGTMISMTRRPTLHDGGFAVRDYSYVRESAFQQATHCMYAPFTPARNATNQLPRALRWGVYANEHITWLDRDTYSLSAKDNLGDDESGPGGRVHLASLDVEIDAIYHDPLT
jgi:hypothetical protein